MITKNGILIVVDGHVTIADFHFDGQGDSESGSISWIAGVIGEHVTKLIKENVGDVSTVLTSDEFMDSHHAVTMTNEQLKKIDEMLEIARSI